MVSEFYPLGVRQKALLREALRRWEMHNVGRRDRVITEAWTGLGSATQYAPVVNAGLMECATQLNPNCITWWRLTEKGVMALIFLGWMEGDK